MEQGLKFGETCGKVRFFYREEFENDVIDMAPEVPEEVVKKGEEAVLNYAQQKIDVAKEKREKRIFVEESIRKNHIPIETEYEDGTNLEGRIIEATLGHITVELDRPVKGGQRSTRFGVYAGMAGHYVFTEDHEISRCGYDSAYTALGRAYKDFLNKPQIDLVSRLNKKVEDKK